MARRLGNSRHPGEACVSIESDNLELLIPDALLDATGDSEDEEMPVRLDVYGGSDELEERGDWLELVRGQITSLEVRQLANGALPQMASWIVTAPGINLLQGEFSRRSDVVGLFWRPWKVAASLLGALVIVMHRGTTRQCHRGSFSCGVSGRKDRS